jgi:ParB-like chromosome segregation protein Spo0J
MSKIEIVYRPIETLSPWPNNPRTHSDDQIAVLVASIQEYGFTNPLLIDEDHVILAGHGRIEAADLAGLKEVPTVMLEGLSDDQKRAYVIADNKLALTADWDLDALEQEFRKLIESDFDMDLTGFADYEIKNLLENADKDAGGDGEDDFNDPIIQYNIVFDDERQQERWYAFMRLVREQFAGDTFAESLDEWINHNVEFSADGTS